LCINRPTTPVSYIIEFLKNNYLAAELQQQQQQQQHQHQQQHEPSTLHNLLDSSSSSNMLDLSSHSSSTSNTATTAASSSATATTIINIVDDSPARVRQSRDRRRRGAISAESLKEVDLDQEPVSFVPKSDETKERLDRALRTNVLFSHLEPHERQDVFDVMFEVTFSAGATIIEQGDQNGDHFYVVDEGECHIFVNGTMVQQVTSGGSFGELALIHGTPRAATVMVLSINQPINQSINQSLLKS
jgi:hypothetical protein